MNLKQAICSHITKTEFILHGVLTGRIGIRLEKTFVSCRPIMELGWGKRG